MANIWFTDFHLNHSIRQLTGTFERYAVTEHLLALVWT